MKKTANLRHLKVQRKIKAKFFKNDPFKHTVSNYSEIRLSGEWLQTYGFNPGDLIIVACYEGKLMITRDHAKMEMLRLQGHEASVKKSIKPYLISLSKQMLAHEATSNFNSNE